MMQIKSHLSECVCGRVDEREVEEGGDCHPGDLDLPEHAAILRESTLHWC